MTDHRQPDLQALRRDLDRLTQEAEELAESVQGESRLAGEETLGAELLAGRELTAQAGILWETAEQLGELCLRQTRLFAEDHTATFRSLLDDSARHSLQTVIGRHLERRLRHNLTGLEQGIDILSTQSERTCQSVIHLWAPFLAVVRRDWAERRPHAGGR
ncbi:MAG: hypothetical protein U5Q16_06130 [Gammaproteobacteria bacterium]|nr:hypothetical protein [Gammaproteobacteria bacterium]